MNCYENGAVCKIIQVMETKITEAIKILDENEEIDKKNDNKVYNINTESPREKKKVPVADIKPELKKIHAIFKSKTKVNEKKTIVSLIIRFFEFHKPKLERLGLDTYDQASHTDVKDFIRDKTVDIVIQHLNILTRANVTNPDKAKIDDLLNVLACIMIVEDNEDCYEKGVMCRRNSDVTNNILKKVEDVAKTNGYSFYCIRCHRLVTWYRRHVGRPIRKLNSTQITKDKECIKKFITREEDLPTLKEQINGLINEMERNINGYERVKYNDSMKMEVDTLKCNLYYLDKLGQSGDADELIETFSKLISKTKFGSKLMTFYKKNMTKELRYKNRQEKLCFEEKEDIVEKIEKIKKKPVVTERLKF